MKKIELYQCDFCHTQYKEKERAERCEETHISECKIKDYRFTQDVKYPSKILIKFADGREIWFRT